MPVATPPLMHPVYPDAALVLGGISRAKLYTEIKAGRIRVVKVGARSFITQAELERYVASLNVGA
ncbi:hypothetical protein GCM10027414_00720 [Humibacter ginsengiterrae]